MAGYQNIKHAEARSARLFDEVFADQRVPFKHVQPTPPSKTSRRQREMARKKVFTPSSDSDCVENSTITSKRPTRKKKPLVTFAATPEKKKKTRKPKPKDKPLQDAVYEAFQKDPYLKHLEELDQHELVVVQDKPGEPRNPAVDEDLRKHMQILFDATSNTTGSSESSIKERQRRKGRTPRELKHSISRVEELLNVWPETDMEEHLTPVKSPRANSTVYASTIKNAFTQHLQSKLNLASTPKPSTSDDSNQRTLRPRPFMQPNKPLPRKAVSISGVWADLDPAAIVDRLLMTSTPVDQEALSADHLDLSTVRENLLSHSSSEFNFSVLRSEMPSFCRTSFGQESQQTYVPIQGNIPDELPSNLSPSKITYLSALETPHIPFMSEDELSRRHREQDSPMRVPTRTTVQTKDSSSLETPNETATLRQSKSSNQVTPDNGSQESSSSSTMVASGGKSPISDDVFKMPDVPRKSHVRASILDVSCQKSFLLKSSHFVDPSYSRRTTAFSSNSTLNAYATPSSKLQVSTASTSRIFKSGASKVNSFWRSNRGSCRTISFKDRSQDLSGHSNETLIEDREELAAKLQNFSTVFTTTKVVDEDGREEIVTACDKVLALCDPTEETSFKDVFTRELLKNICKIGEGSYAEVFSIISPDGTKSVIKLIAFDSNEDEETVFAQLLPELVIVTKLTRLANGKINRTPNFIQISRASCIRGKYPKKLLKVWDAFDEEKQSENENPRNYGKNHLHLAMFLNDGGPDVESYVFNSAEQSLGMFLQVAFSLAAAEAQFEFEHRDLHWGNILVREDYREEPISYVVAGMSYQIPSGGVIASVIDFTLSRMREDDITVFDDLEKYPDLFEGEGDIQFDIYRMMRKHNKGDWESFNPKSNVFWLYYLLDKLIKLKKYKSRSKEHQQSLLTLQRLHKAIQSFSSTKDFIESALIAQVLCK